MHGLIRASVLGAVIAALVALVPGTTPAETPVKKQGKRAQKAAADKAAADKAAADKAAADKAAKGLAAAKAEKKSGPFTPAKGSLPEGARLESAALARHIDKLIGTRLQTDKVDPSGRCDDAEFVRRVHLDLVGRVPTAEQAAAFLASSAPDKRAKLIDELLASKDHGKHQADVWQALMLPRDSEAFRIRQYFPHLVKWLEEGFNENKPWDRMVKEILTASGPVDKTSPTVYYLANGTVDKMTDSFSRLFLGVQLQCAQCHNHPFTDWKQDEYWGMAAFFIKVRPDGNPRAAAKAGNTISISEAKQLPKGKQRLPDSAKILPAKYLQGDHAKVSAGDPARPALAEWATSPKNPFLPRALVNRTWAQLFGRGFVNPIDDMHEQNAASHPELLADLSGQFVAAGFDVKYLLRAICNSEAYQRTSKSAGNNGDAGPELFSRMPIKVLTPEQLFDSLTQVLGSGDVRPGAAARKMAGFQRGPGGPREAFIAFYNLEDGVDPTEFQAGIPQVLRLMNGPQFNPTPAATRLTRSAKDWKEGAETLYLATLSRRPTPVELERVGRYLERHKGDARAAAGDLLWALINCSEFAVNH